MNYYALIFIANTYTYNSINKIFLYIGICNTSQLSCLVHPLQTVWTLDKMCILYVKLLFLSFSYPKLVIYQWLVLTAISKVRQNKTSLWKQTLEHVDFFSFSLHGPCSYLLWFLGYVYKWFHTHHYTMKCGRQSVGE